MFKCIRILVAIVFVFFAKISLSQSNGPNALEIATWSLIQLLPSPTFYQDKNNEYSRTQFGLKWNITPVNYSFNANRLISPLQFFKVNPMRRYGGSVELFVQPEWTTSAYKYSDIARFSISPGIRLFAPLVEYGEYLSGSLGMKYTVRKDKQSDFNNTPGIEFGLYTFYGIAGFNFTYNFTNESRYNFSINFKYY